jgi:hypothetical protein
MYRQYDTIRKVRTAFSNFSRSSTQANISVTAFSDDKGKADRLVYDPVSSYWFGKFFLGCRRRMGQDWRPNLALSTELIVGMLDKVNERAADDSQLSLEEKHDWIVFGTYVMVTYVLSLRGPEGLLVDLDGLRRNMNKWTHNYLIVALRGKVKGEHMDRCHLLPCCVLTSSGIEVRVTRLVNIKQLTGQVNGPAISDSHGKIYTTSWLDDKMVSVLEDMYEENQSAFPAIIRGNKDKIGNVYQVFRSLRRSSDTQAIEEKVARTDIKTINRWHGTEQAMGNRPHRPMYQHYAQMDLLLKPYLRNTEAM